MEQAVLLALQQNPDILRAKEEIKRNEGIILEIVAQALPHVTPSGTFDFTDPKLRINDSAAAVLSRPRAVAAGVALATAPV